MPPKSPLDRRKFFGSAAALSLSAASYANVLGANECVRVAFLGCGARAQAHIDLVNRLSRDGKPVAAVAVCDVWDGQEDEYDVEFGGKVARRRYVQGLFPSAKKCGLDPANRSHVTKDYRRLLELQHVDAVCISTPDHWHGKMTVDALNAGKDVFVETPMTRTAEEAMAVVDAWKRSGRIVTVGAQSMADPVWVTAFDRIRTGTIGHIAHGQTGVFRNDIRGQWRFYRLTPNMTPKTIDWPMFLGHGIELNGQKIGPELPFDRAAFAQWRCSSHFSGGPFTDLIVQNVTHLLAAMGVRFPARVTAGGGLFLETDGRDVPDVASVIADFDEGCQLLVTASALSGYPLEEVIRGRLGAVKFVRGGYQLYRDDPTRGATFPPRLERTPEPDEFVTCEPPRNETEALWENFLDSVQSRWQSTFSPPDLGAAATTLTAMALQSYRSGQAQFWNKEHRTIATGVRWAERWEQRSKSRAKPNQIFGWSGGDAGSTMTPPSYQNLAGPWVNGKEPGV